MPEKPIAGSLAEKLSGIAIVCLRWKQSLSIFRWLRSLNASTKSAFGSIAGYVLGQKNLENYLLDGRLEISNNRAERSIKPFVIGRKNFLFANTTRGAQASAVMYSLVETAKENGIKPYDYIAWLLRTAPGMRLKEASEAAEQLTPEAFQREAENK